MELGRPILDEVAGGLALLTLNRPSNGNALAPDAIARALEALHRHMDDESVRVVVLRARGEVFCAGMDLAALTEEEEPDPGELAEATGRFVELLELIAAGAKPVVAAVTGDLRAGGVGLAGACDLVYAVESVRAQLGEVVLGLIPANIMPVLVGRRIGLGDFRRLALTACTVDAREAQRIGLVDEVFEGRAELEKALRRTLKQLFRASPRAIAALKSLVGSSVSPGVRAKRYAFESFLELASDPAVLEGIRAFRDGDTPPWFSRFRREEPIILEE